ncbi:hypothetical protein H0H81_009680, partial [Sphagnurus paluster]
PVTAWGKKPVMGPTVVTGTVKSSDQSTMKSNTTRVPQWLEKHTSSAYMNSINQELSAREEKRMLARYLSCHPPPTGVEDGTPSPNPRRSSKLSDCISKLMSSKISTVPRPAPHIHYSVVIANQDQNQIYNRYGDIHPYDRTRVVVQKDPLHRGEDQSLEQGKYLNASWVLERYGHKWWIASQAPLPNTSHTFLSLFLQQSTSPPHSILSGSTSQSRPRTIVQLTNDVEGGRRKAHPYFPAQVGQSFMIPSEDPEEAPLKVTLRKQQSIPDARCVCSTVSVLPVPLSRSSVDGTIEDQLPVTFQHLLYTSWPDHGVPKDEDRASLLAFLRLVDSTNRDTTLAPTPDPDPDPPVVVGCSAGVGRTGSFIALSSLLRHFGFLPPPGSPSPSSSIPESPLGPLPSHLSEDLVLQEIDFLREQRPAMVQRNEQTLLIYQILASTFS